MCPHGKYVYHCVECNGSGVCKHKKWKDTCMECNGARCEHGRHKDKCVDCKGSRICDHNKRFDLCGLCAGGALCMHRIQKTSCSICDYGRYLVGITHKRVNSALRYQCVEGTEDLRKYIGCTAAQLAIIIRNKMVEKKMIDSIDSVIDMIGIHIDHIKPISRFNLDKGSENFEKELKQCMHYTNLQPLWAKENLSKKNKWSDEEEKDWRENIIDKSLL